MRCPDARQNLSFYLYGELDFETEEAIEQHLNDCQECRDALKLERAWHNAIGSEPAEVPLELLSQCRRDLHESVSAASETKQPLWIRALDSLGFRSNAWSMRIAMASLLVCLGFGLSRWSERYEIPNPAVADGTGTEMSLLNPLRAHVRNIEASPDDRVQIVVDEIREHVITGSRDDARIRRLLLAASKDPTDPAIRVDSLDLLKNDTGDDVREALVDTVRHDPNAGVRLKALEALGQFSDDPGIRDAIVFVLAHDQSPDVRTQAINILVPPQTGVKLNPQVADMLESLMHSDPDGYIRLRCQQALRHPQTAVHVY